MADTVFQPYARSPLHHLNLPARVASLPANSTAWANEVALLGYISLRGDLADPAVVDAIQAVLGVNPPVPGHFANSDKGLLLWLSPDECLLITSRALRDTVLAAFDSKLQPLHAQAVDQSGGLTLIYLSGKDHITVLRHLGVYDFESITPGQAIGTVFGKSQTQVIRVDEAGVFLTFRRSFADYLWKMLEQAGRPYHFAVGALPQSGSHALWRLHGSSSTPVSTQGVSHVAA